MSSKKHRWPKKPRNEGLRAQVQECLNGCGCVRWWPALSSYPQYEMNNETFALAPSCTGVTDREIKSWVEKTYGKIISYDSIEIYSVELRTGGRSRYFKIISDGKMIGQFEGIAHNQHEYFARAKVHLNWIFGIKESAHE